jgi:hypothetical protein
METIVGFAVGYLVGVREGPGGLERIRASWRTIRDSQELRELAAGALAVAGPVIRQAVSGGAGAVLRTAYDAVTSRESGSASGHRATTRAA